MADRPKITAEKQSVDFNQFGTWNFVKVCLSNEKRHNALTPAMMLDLVDIVDRIKSNGENGLSDERTVAIVLTGSGKSFCAGLDLSVAKTQLLTPEAGLHMCTVMQRTLDRFRNLPIMSVAAVNGPAIGGGAELTTACDFRVMCPRARIQFVQAKMGVTPGWGGGGRLVQILGSHIAFQVLCSARNLHTDDAKRLGLCDQVQPEDDTRNLSQYALEEFLLKNYLLDHANNALHPIPVLRKIKDMISTYRHSSFEKSLEYEKEVFYSLWGNQWNLEALERTTKK